MEMKPTRVSISLLGEVHDVPRIQRVVLHFIAAKSNICILVKASEKN